MFRSNPSFVVLAALAVANAAHGASLSLEVIGGYDVPGYDAGVVFGDTIEIRVTGDAMGAATTHVFAQLLWTGSGTISLRSSQVPMTSFGGALPWTTGFLDQGCPSTRLPGPASSTSSAPPVPF